MKKKEQKTEFVFKGKDFKSNKRANEKIERLKKMGYKLVESNSKKLTFKK